jgi:hypothetical protein
MPKIDAEVFSVTVIQVLLERLVENGVITAVDQRAIYLEAAEVLTRSGDKGDSETITYLKYLAYGVDTGDIE